MNAFKTDSFTLRVSLFAAMRALSFAKACERFKKIGLQSWAAI